MMPDSGTTPIATVLPPSKRSATLHLVQSSRMARRLAKLLVVGLVLSALAMALLPWQQTSRGTGSVVAYVPQERQQTIQAPAKGVVIRIADGLVEGSQVQRGDFILEIQPFAADMVQQLEAQRRELRTEESSTQAKADALAQTVEGYTEARDFAVEAAEQLVQSAQAKLESKQRLVPGYEAKELQARLDYERQSRLFEQGAKSELVAQKQKKEWDVAQAELESIQQEVASLQKELTAKQNEREEKRRIAQTKVDYARAQLQEALGKAAKIRKEIGDVEIKLGEMSRLTITAPRDGTIFRMPIFELGQTLKEGDPILTIVPEVTQKAVELLVPGNDMPLIRPGQEVRLQFEGWPAVQFAGWPSVAVGSFGGQVTSVDATDNGVGQFRILITPHPERAPWPSNRNLRQGVRVNGWVLLKRVSLGYELWRQLNGFPVILSDKEPGESKVKVPKVPK